jgi:hypothetical protein
MTFLTRDGIDVSTATGFRAWAQIITQDLAEASVPVPLGVGMAHICEDDLFISSMICLACEHQLDRAACGDRDKDLAAEGATALEFMTGSRA